MLAPVTANQIRFVTPGLSTDSRGVALGRYCAVLLPSIDRVVGLFRGLSERTSLDDLLPALQILHVVTPLKSREFIVLIPTASSHVADGIRGVATLMGGLTFTGSTKHFVQLRDSRAPLGYDVDGLHADKADFILYASEFTQTYHTQREVSFSDLVLSLSLQRQRQDRLQPEESVLLRVAPGLWRVVTTYLHRNRLPCEVSACEQESALGAFYLVRTRLLPRMEGLFSSTPGIEVYRLITDAVAVQVGYRHPVELGSCTSIFDKDTFYLFSGQRDCLDTVVGGLTFVDARSLVHLIGSSEHALTAAYTSVSSLESFEVPLRLVSAQGTRPPVRASLIPLDQAAWLKKLIYLLPPQVLQGTTICQTGQGIFLYSDSAMEAIPLGTLFYQAALGVMIPVGYELLPRIHPDVLVQHLDAGADALIFFCGQSRDKIVKLQRSDFTILSRRALASVRVEPVSVPSQHPEATDAPSLINDPLGIFPLWGFSDEEKEPDR